MYFGVTLPIASKTETKSKTEWSQVASSLSIERTNVSQNLLVTEGMKGNYKDTMMLLPTTKLVVKLDF